MATRETQTEAHELFQRLSRDYPTALFAIRERREGKGWPRQLVTVYDVVEVRDCCRCAAHYDSLAIGEADARLCPACSNARRVEIEAEHERLAAEQAARVRWGEWFDRTDGLPGQ